MKTSDPPQPTSSHGDLPVWWPRVTSLVGLFGSLACSMAMVLAIVGVVGAGTVAGTHVVGGTRSMANMDGHGAVSVGYATGVLGLLIRFGPQILVVSVFFVALGISMLRRAGAVAAVAAGVLLYWAMYEQANVALMYATIVLGYGIWMLDYLWAKTGFRFSVVAGGVDNGASSSDEDI